MHGNTAQRCSRSSALNAAGTDADACSGAGASGSGVRGDEGDVHEPCRCANIASHLQTVSCCTASV